jgi:hypothetical protein
MGSLVRAQRPEKIMTLPHASSARQFDRHPSVVVKGLLAKITRLTMSTPSTPQNSAVVGVGDVGDDEVVVAASVVAVTSEDELEEIETEDDVEGSLDDGLEEVLVLISLVDMDSRVEVGLLGLVVEALDDETTSQFPNPGWQPAPQYALELPQYEYSEQQSPYFPPRQIIPAGDAPYRFPQRAFVVTWPFT